MTEEKRKEGINRGNAGKGRPKGSLNKTTTALKEAILIAAENAGGTGGIVGYLTLQASENPTAFMGILGKVLPMTVAGDESAPIVHRIVREIVRPRN